MAGLLGWLDDVLGGSSDNSSGTPMQPGPGSVMGSLNPMGDPTGGSMPLPTPASAPTQPMPPIQQTGDNGPSPPLPQGGDPMDGTGSGNSGGLPMPTGGDPMDGTGSGNNGGLPPGMPMPRPRPPGADAAVPPNAAPTSGGQPPGPPLDLLGSGVNGVGPGLGVGAPSPQADGGSRISLLRAMGLDPNTADRVRGSLGAGLKSVGENWNKPGLAAFAGSAGAGIEGGKNADDKTTDKQNKYLANAIAAKRAGDTATYNVEYLKYLKQSAADKLDAEKKKQADGGSKGGINAPEQLYLRGNAAAVSENSVLKSQYDKTAQQFGADSKEAKGALDAYNKGLEASKEKHFSRLGLDPKKASEIGGKPGMSDQNPVKSFPKDPAAAQKAFDALPEGAYFINPKDGRLLIKKGAGSASASNPAQQPIAPGAPPAPAAPALATANAEEEE